MDCILPNEILALIIRANDIYFATKLALASKYFLYEFVFAQLARVAIDTEQFWDQADPALRAASALVALAKHRRNFTSVQELEWHFGVEDELPRAECAAAGKFLSSIAPACRNISTEAPGKRAEAMLINELLKNYDPERLESLKIRCFAITLTSIQSALHSRLTTIDLGNIRFNKKDLQRLASYCKVLERATFLFKVDTQLPDWRTPLFDALKELCVANPGLKHLHVDLISSFNLLHFEDSYILYQLLSHLLLRNSELDPVIHWYDLDKLCRERLSIPASVLMLCRRSVWEICFCCCPIDDLDRIDTTTLCDSMFDHFLAKEPASTQARLLQRLALRLLNPILRPSNVRDLLDWIEATVWNILEPLQDACRAEIAANVIVVSGVRALLFGNGDPSALESIAFCRKLLESHRDPMQLLLTPPATQQQPRSRDALFASVLNCVDWCNDEVVMFDARMVEKMAAALRNWPHRMEMFAQHSKFSPHARIASVGIPFLPWLILTALESPYYTTELFEATVFLLETAAAIGCTIPAASFEISTKFFQAIIHEKDAVEAFARVIDSVDRFLDPTFLAPISSVKLIDQLALMAIENERHATSSQVVSTAFMNALRERLWRFTLWETDAEREGIMRSHTMSLVHLFNDIPEFVVEFMMGKNDDLVRGGKYDALRIRAALRDILPAEDKKCSIM